MGRLIGLAGNTNREQAAGRDKARDAPVRWRVPGPRQRRRAGGWLAAVGMVAAHRQQEEALNLIQRYEGTQAAQGRVLFRYGNDRPAG
jgi:hypothetical protein